MSNVVSNSTVAEELYQENMRGADVVNRDDAPVSRTDEIQEGTRKTIEEMKVLDQILADGGRLALD